MNRCCMRCLLFLSVFFLSPLPPLLFFTIPVRNSSQPRRSSPRHVHVRCNNGSHGRARALSLSICNAHAFRARNRSPGKQGAQPFQCATLHALSPRAASLTVLSQTLLSGLRFPRAPTSPLRSVRHHVPVCARVQQAATRHSLALQDRPPAAPDSNRLAPPRETLPPPRSGRRP